ncbi:MAG: hypothetical protein N2C14_08215, partial [Planctomycetales bacterium]
CFALFFWSRCLGGTADVLEVVLFLAGAACIGMEIFVIPGFGVFGLSGLALMFAGLLMACHANAVPQSPAEWNRFVTTLGVFTGSMVAFMATAATLSQYLESVPLLGRIVLKPPPPEETTEEESMLSKALVLGRIGKATTALRPTGKVRFGDLFVEVVAEDDVVQPGEEVEIIALEGQRVIVRPLASDAKPT